MDCETVPVSKVAHRVGQAPRSVRRGSEEPVRSGVDVVDSIREAGGPAQLDVLLRSSAPESRAQTPLQLLHPAVRRAVVARLQLQPLGTGNLRTTRGQRTEEGAPKGGNATKERRMSRCVLYHYNERFRTLGLALSITQSTELLERPQPISAKTMPNHESTQQTEFREPKIRITM
ncbi:unnamed protein product [Heligmosomoides polygyrus]|uniref:Uncharacterized protein n=1 Tax=Heligmosomoides polygyrus TaxID=6339 RepID=A0A183GSZ1_HELPZ|nr:unnamed protein product [Heligmosomoides polygyrus]